MDTPTPQLNLQGCATLAQEVIRQMIEDRYRTNTMAEPRQRGEQLLHFADHEIIGLVCSVYGYDVETWRNKIRVKALNIIEYADRQDEALRGNDIPVPMCTQTSPVLA